jgi:hypothetical protein
MRGLRIPREIERDFAGAWSLRLGGGPLLHSSRSRLAVLRSLFIIAVVAAIATGLSRLEHAHSQISTISPAWVRTVDGWEPSSVLTTPSPAPSPVVHPALVAGFQLGASVFVLLAFPYRKSR